MPKLTKYNCPDCNTELYKADLVDAGNGQKKCPECGALLKFEEVKSGHKFSYHLIRADSKPEEAPGMDTPIAQLPPKVGTLLTGDGEIPEIWLMDKGDEDKGVPPKFRVIYTGIIVRDWVYCPHCNGKMFQNMYIDTGEGESGQMHRCQHCKTDVEFIFKSVGYIRTRS